jgi:hypothetical protein
MKSLKIKSSSFFIVILTILIHVSCRKQYDEPPITQIPDGNVITIADLKGMYAGSDLSISEDYNIYANVTTDETDGNFYKEAYIQDATGAIRLRLLASGGLYIGDSIRINLNGTVLSEYNGMIQLDSVDVDKNIVKQATQKFISPTTYSVNQISPALQGYLVQLNDVEFISDELGSTYADAINQFSENRTLTDCNGNTILVRTSGYANFANNTIPADNGSIIAIVGVFGPDLQLYIRDINELDFTNTRCSGGSGAILSKDFDDGSVTSGGWTNYNVSGTIDWETSTAGGAPDPYGNISNWNGSGNDPCETWLISPAIDLTSTTNPYLNFENAYNFFGDPLELYVSTDYDGTSAPSTANWSPLTFTLSTGSFSWVNSGNITLQPYISANTYIAFKYIGGSNDGSNWEVDDIIIQE